MTLAGQVFALVVAGVAPKLLGTGPEAFMIDRYPNILLCEKINDTLGILLTLKTNTH